jgi:hypothetical protein
MSRRRKRIAFSRKCEAFRSSLHPWERERRREFVPVPKELTPVRLMIVFAVINLKAGKVVELGTPGSTMLVRCKMINRKTGSIHHIWTDMECYCCDSASDQSDLTTEDLDQINDLVKQLWWDKQ